MQHTEPYFPFKFSDLRPLKADQKSFILLNTATIFFLANLFFLKHGISSEYVMVDFICMGLLDM